MPNHSFKLCIKTITVNKAPGNCAYVRHQISLQFLFIELAGMSVDNRLQLASHHASYVYHQVHDTITLINTWTESIIYM